MKLYITIPFLEEILSGKISIKPNMFPYTDAKIIDINIIKKNNKLKGIYLILENYVSKNDAINIVKQEIKFHKSLPISIPQNHFTDGYMEGLKFTLDLFKKYEKDKN